MIVVAIIGILAAVAIPAFMKYIRRSKTVEATMNVRKLFDSSVSYFEGEHADTTGNVLAKQFPTSRRRRRRRANACCGNTGDKCKPDADQLHGATRGRRSTSRSTIRSTSVTSTTRPARRRASNFQAWAFGDLDCDSIYVDLRALGLGHERPLGLGRLGSVLEERNRITIVAWLPKTPAVG